MIHLTLQRLPTADFFLSINFHKLAVHFGEDVNVSVANMETRATKTSESFFETSLWIVLSPLVVYDVGCWGECLLPTVYVFCTVQVPSTRISGC